MAWLEFDNFHVIIMSLYTNNLLKKSCQSKDEGHPVFKKGVREGVSERK